jgi:glutamine---fructose-6-phosphate transaminase (isomerizing)
MILSKVRDDCKRVAKLLVKHQTLFILGKGYGEPIAMEGSLKIKEITYTHAEAYASGALKHGPFALIEKGTPIIFIHTDDEHYSLNDNAIHQVASRGATVIVITDLPDEKLSKNVIHDYIKVPSNGMLTHLLCVIPLQLISFELSMLKGINPDKPKNLAKVINFFIKTKFLLDVKIFNFNLFF